jgi:hypothetical protein
MRGAPGERQLTGEAANLPSRPSADGGDGQLPGIWSAAHLIDLVIPHVPMRQWVLALPIPLRLLLAAQPKLLTPVL